LLNVRRKNINVLRLVLPFSNSLFIKLLMYK